MITVKGDQRYFLLYIRVFLLYPTNGLQGFVHTCECLFADNIHRTTFINDNQVVNSLCLNFICLHNRNFFKW